MDSPVVDSINQGESETDPDHQLSFDMLSYVMFKKKKNHKVKEEKTWL